MLDSSTGTEGKGGEEKVGGQKNVHLFYFLAGEADPDEVA